MFTRRDEFHFDPTILAHRRDTAEQSQRLSNAIAQMYFKHALLTDCGKWLRC